MSSTTNSDSVKRTAPIPISVSRHSRHRSSSGSDSSTDESSSSNSPNSSPLRTPLSLNPSNITTVSPTSSPILSYFMSQSPTKSPGAAAVTFPFRRGFNGGAPPVIEDDDEAQDNRNHHSAHARRASTAYAGRFNQPPTGTLPEAHQERGSGLLRRLSLGSALRPPIPQPPTLAINTKRPTTPPSTPMVPSNTPATPLAPRARTRKVRAATLGPGAPPRRAPSPMGERILKGHFDGFN
ncbi:hypothetical protein JAAARDRAFT_194206 [Jaapia argillacea MUCL 33604]|uniref:Uncharacterized protein n=1 Tax=Jaapia argillacea MUCL 33604 TaxID=933084 RepID=A0A067Q0L2_9AGAM|nr:hypothetical protein JAAARDRAFT_194206 [Jaapia argillacea MUCL 33604]